MKHAYSSFILCASCAALLGGCSAAGNDYPSLAVREAERQVGQFTPAPPLAAVPAAPAGDMLDMLTGSVEKARAAHQQFMTQREGAMRLTNTGPNASLSRDARDSRRASALIAMAGLSALHSQTKLALSNLDQLEFDAAAAFAPTGDINAAQILVTQMIREQDAALDSLNTAIAP